MIPPRAIESNLRPFSFLYIGEGYGGFYLQKTYTPTRWMTRSSIANTLARGIRQQMPFCACCKLSLKQWIVVRLLLDCSSLISQTDSSYWPHHWPSWPTSSKQLESEELCKIDELRKEEYDIGTKLGVIVFAVMTNKFLCDWHLRIKFIDDITALDIIPRNGISLLNVVASDIHNFAISHNTKLTLYHQQIKSVSISRGLIL